VEEGNELLVDQAGEDRHHDVQAGGVGDPKAVDEAWRDALALHPLGDDVAPTVDYYNVYPLLLKGDQVLQTGVMAAQGTAPDLHHYRQAGHFLLPLAISSQLSAVSFESDHSGLLSPSFDKLRTGVGED
jgi:hypothetical protein